MNNCYIKPLWDLMKCRQREEHFVNNGYIIKLAVISRVDKLSQTRILTIKSTDVMYITQGRTINCLKVMTESHAERDGEYGKCI